MVTGSLTRIACDGQGGADDIVKYSMTVEYPSLMPVKMFGWTGKRSVTGNKPVATSLSGSQAVLNVVKCEK